MLTLKSRFYSSLAHYEQLYWLGGSCPPPLCMTYERVVAVGASFGYELPNDPYTMFDQPTPANTERET